MGDKVVALDGENLYVKDKTYNLTPALITHRQPKGEEYTADDYITYGALVTETNVKTMQVLLTHTVHGNGSICSGKCLHLWKAYQTKKKKPGKCENDSPDDQRRTM